MAITKVTSGLISADAASVDLNIDAGTLYVDSTNNRVGIANTNPSDALDVTGNIVVSGTVDGRDLATDGSKLDGIESGATADQTQSEINALGITATGLSGTPNITVGTINSGAIESTSSITSNTFIQIVGASGSSGFMYIYDRDNGTSNTDGLLLQKSGNNAFVYNRESSGSLSLGAGDTSNYLVIDSSGNIDLGTTQILDQSRNLTNIGTISSGDITITDTSADPFLKLATSEREYVVRIDNSDSDKFQIRDVTGAATRVTLDTSGNVGIGTDAPDLKLHVAHSDSNNGLLLEHTSQASGYQYLLNARETEGLIFQRWANGSFSSNTMTLGYNNYVGIGTTEPDTPLHIESSSGINGLVKLESSDIEANIVFTDNGTTDTVNIGCRNNDLKLRADIGNIRFFTGTAGTSTERIRIDSSGNFQVGSTPQTVIDQSRNLTNIGTISSGNITASGTDAQILATGDNAIALHQDAAWVSNLLFGAKHDGSNQVYGASSRGAFKIVSLHDSDSSPQYLAIYGANQGTAGSTISWNTVGFAQDEDGKVGIGTTDPGSILHLYANDPQILLDDSGTQSSITGQSGNILYKTSSANRDHTFYGVNAEVARITGDGNVGIGTSDPSYPLQISESANTNVQVDIETNSTNDYNGYLSFSDSGGVRASIRCDHYNNALKFNFGGLTTERMRINSSGQVSINDTTDPDASGEMLQVRGTNNTHGPIVIRNASGDQSAYRMIHYYKKEETSPIAITALDVTGSAVTHSYLSDERLKDELGSADGLNLISELNPIKFRFKDGTGTGSQGFTAQGFKQAFDNVGSFPRGVTVPDNPDEYWLLDDKVLIPNLVKAIQELKEENDNLKARIEVIENG